MPRTGENIFKRKDGRWEARYIHHYEDGKAKYHYLYASSYREVRQKKLDALAALQASGTSGITWADLSALWLREMKILVKESTYTRYERIIRCYLSPHLPKEELDRWPKHLLSRFPEYLLNQGGVKGNSLSSKTVVDILCVLKVILKFAREKDFPCPDPSCIKFPKKNVKKRQCLNRETQTAIEQLLDPEDVISLGIIFALYTGIRIGELCGLRWGDLDLDAGFMQISRTVERIADLNLATPQKTKVIIQEPKTEHSLRTIPIPAFLIAYLRPLQASAEIYFLSGKATPMEPHRYYVRYQTFLRKHRLDHQTFHALRHTFATRCVELGFDAKSLSEILGHANVSTTLSIYVHPTLQQKKQQIELLATDRYLQSNPQDKPEKSL